MQGLPLGFLLHLLDKAFVLRIAPLLGIAAVLFHHRPTGRCIRSHYYSLQALVRTLVQVSSSIIRTRVSLQQDQQENLYTKHMHKKGRHACTNLRIAAAHNSQVSADSVGIWMKEQFEAVDH